MMKTKIIIYNNINPSHVTGLFFIPSENIRKLIISDVLGFVERG